VVGNISQPYVILLLSRSLTAQTLTHVHISRPSVLRSSDVSVDEGSAEPNVQITII